MTDFKSIATTHLKGFAKALISLLRQEQYDIIIAPANSGSAMIGFAEIVTQAAGINLPRTLILPVFDGSAAEAQVNNSAIVPKIRANESLEKEYTSILFLDGEINLGGTFSSVMQAMKDSGKLHQLCRATILAEGNGLIWDYPSKHVQSDFLPYALRPNLQWHDLVFNLVPYYMIEDFQDKVDMRLSPKEVATMLFGLPLKDLSNGEPYLNYELLEKAQMKIHRFKDYQMQWLEIATGTISKAIAEQEAKEKARAFESRWGFSKLLFDT